LKNIKRKLVKQWSKRENIKFKWDSEFIFIRIKINLILMVLRILRIKWFGSLSWWSIEKYKLSHSVNHICFNPTMDSAVKERKRVTFEKWYLIKIWPICIIKYLRKDNGYLEF
jgi:hypothetical protein